MTLNLNWYDSGGWKHRPLWLHVNVILNIWMEIRFERSNISTTLYYETTGDWDNSEFLVLGNWNMSILIREKFDLKLSLWVFISLLLTDKRFSLPCRDLSCPTSPSGQMNYLSPPSISEAGIIGRGNLEFSTAVKASPWIRRTVNHHKAIFRGCLSFSDFPDLDFTMSPQIQDQWTQQMASWKGASTLYSPVYNINWYIFPM